MTIEEFNPNRPSHLTTVLKRVAGPFKLARQGGAALVKRVPPTVSAAKTGTQATTKALQTLSDSTLRWLAASSIGLGAGLYLSGRRRLTVAAGVVPALAAGAAIALRPTKRAAAPDSHARPAG